MNRSKLIHRQCTWVIQRQNTIRVTHVTLICNKTTKQQQKINTNNTNVYITDNKNKRKQNYVKKKKKT